MSRSDKWDKEQREMETKITFTGDHIHAIQRNGKCKVCGLTVDEIHRRSKR